ncbi:MAG: Rne/Rng family ribonuclease, partial [Gammaproteobacteria bacterium]
MKDALHKLEIPNEMGVIVRTAGVGRSGDELRGDFEYLLQVWDAIKDASAHRKAPFLIYQESNVILRTIRDCLRQDISEILIDHDETYQEALDFIRAVMPHYEPKLKHYTDSTPLFSRFQIESQIETAFQREVKLPSGGSIVIDPTEALVSIDINSARSTKGADLEETALHTNLEAAEEIARQLRLRDIGGLIVVDFIDMLQNRHQREVESKMRAVLELDRARVQISRISRFGLLELSRQRLRASLEETLSKACPRCSGLGTIRDVRSLSLSIMRLVEEEAMKEGATEVQAQLPVDVATYLLNEKRLSISEIEEQHNVRVLVIPNPYLDSPHYELTRKKSNETNTTSDASSYDLVHTPEIDQNNYLTQDTNQVLPQRAAVSTIPPANSKTTRHARKESAALHRFSNWLSHLFRGEASTQANDTPSSAPTSTHSPQQSESGLERPSTGSRSESSSSDNALQGQDQNKRGNRQRTSNRRRDRDSSGRGGDTSRGRSRDTRSRDRDTESNRNTDTNRNPDAALNRDVRRDNRDNANNAGDGEISNQRRRSNGRDQRRNGRRRQYNDNPAQQDRSSESESTLDTNVTRPVETDASESSAHAKSDNPTHTSRYQPTHSDDDAARYTNKRSTENATDDQPNTDRSTAPDQREPSEDTPSDNQRESSGRGRRGGRNQTSRGRSSRRSQNDTRGDNRSHSANEQSSETRDNKVPSADASSEPALNTTTSTAESKTAVKAHAENVQNENNANANKADAIAGKDSRADSTDKTADSTPAAPKQRGRATNDPRLKRKLAAQQAATSAAQQAEVQQEVSKDVPKDVPKEVPK